ncbi:CerR family C-terminal domain-containing protein [Croceicoccus naphthovorans]|uniref:CerR family C-terminal domain-containing protein n=1 Tax=Croceicoccus naphthovorans TaxID=1348774 RepID=UPI00146FEB5D|nr:CerR family C-terminal domain-containing protein [Croceicoccus naphthovorans]MBB3989763.1 AcrR family transcriptional regulator [Croceicoccus naphthovorans]
MNAAIRLFGRVGYDGASTRAIAAACGKPMSAITYHFGGKRGLYLAAAEHIAAKMSERIAPLRAIREGVDLDNADFAVIEEALHRMIDIGIGVVTDPAIDDFVNFVLREQAEPTDAFQPIFEGVMSPILTQMTTLLAAAADPPMPEGEARIRAAMLIGQIVFFRTCRAAALRHCGWAGIGDAERQEIAAAAHSHLSIFLSGLRRGEHQ